MPVAIMASKVRKHCSSRVRGFTLIEIVITMGISLLLMAGVIINYNTYNDTQKLKQAALTVKNDFRFYQAKALSGEKPVDPTGVQTPDQFCRQLLGYQVTFASSSYTFKAKCNPDQPSAPDKTYTLPQTIAFSPVPASFVFLVVSRGTTLSTVTQIILASSSRQYTVNVSPGGDISDVGLN